MKKILFIFILIISCIINVKAYENEYFKIDIPENFKETLNENGNYKWEKDNKYISITISDNTELKYNVESYTEEDIQNKKKYIETNINKELEKYNTQVTVTDIKKQQIKDDIYSINYTIYWPTKEFTGYDMYQIGNVILSNKYILTIIYSSNDELNTEEYEQIISSLEIKDEFTKQVLTNKQQLILVTIIAGIFSSIHIIKKYKNKN